MATENVAIGARTEPRLRTKDGCVTCRRQRKKCDGGLPQCRRCQVGSRVCVRPSTDELRDKRYGKRSGVFKRNRRRPSGPRKDEQASMSATSGETLPWLGTGSNTLAKTDLELMLTGYFFAEFLPLITLTQMQHTESKGFPDDVRKSMWEHNDLKYVVLACSAAHLHKSGTNFSFLEAPVLYHQSLKEVNKSVTELHEKEVPVSDGLIMAVMFLIVYGVLCPERESNLFHLKAIIHLLKLRLSRGSTFTHKTWPITMLELHAIDSTLFHIFRAAVWNPTTPGFLVDADFWLMAERLLNHGKDSGAYSSLVLGFPASFYRMVLCMVQYVREPSGECHKTLAGLEAEISFYNQTFEDEAIRNCLIDTGLGLHNTHSPIGHSYQLCLLVATLIPINPFLSGQQRTLGFLGHEAQSIVQRAITLLCEARLIPGWPRCYLGCWPSFLLGFCVSRPEHVHVIRNEFSVRISVCSLHEYNYMLTTLESFWAQSHVLGSVCLLQK